MEMNNDYAQAVMHLLNAQGVLIELHKITESTKRAREIENCLERLDYVVHSLGHFNYEDWLLSTP